MEGLGVLGLDGDQICSCLAGRPWISNVFVAVDIRKEGVGSHRRGVEGRVNREEKGSLE